MTTAVEPKRILVVEDELLIAHEIVDALERLGYVALEPVDTAAAALRAAAKHSPDLVLMDINLAHNSDGVQAATQLRAELHVPVVFLTASSDPATLERAQYAEPYGFIVKPFGDIDLQTTLKMALFKHAQDEATRQRADTLGATLAALDEAVVGVTPELRITYRNPTAEAWLGNTPGQPTQLLPRLVVLFDEEHRKQPWAEVLARAAPGTRQRYSAFFPETDEQVAIQVSATAAAAPATGWTVVLTPAPAPVPATPPMPADEAEILGDAVFVKQGKRHLKVYLRDILWVEARENYMELYTRQGRHLVYGSMRDLESKLDEGRFVRIHRSYLVQLAKIDALEEGYVVVDGQSLPVSRSFKEPLRQRLRLL